MRDAPALTPFAPLTPTRSPLPEPLRGDSLSSHLSPLDHESGSPMAKNRALPIRTVETTPIRLAPVSSTPRTRCDSCATIHDRHPVREIPLPTPRNAPRLNLAHRPSSMCSARSAGSGVGARVDPRNARVLVGLGQRVRRRRVRWPVGDVLKAPSTLGQPPVCRSGWIPRPSHAPWRIVRPRRSPRPPSPSPICAVMSYPRRGEGEAGRWFRPAESVIHCRAEW